MSGTPVGITLTDHKVLAGITQAGHESQVFSRYTATLVIKLPRPVVSGGLSLYTRRPFVEVTQFKVPVWLPSNEWGTGFDSGYFIRRIYGKGITATGMTVPLTFSAPDLQEEAVSIYALPGGPYETTYTATLGARRPSEALTEIHIPILTETTIIYANPGFTELGYDLQFFMESATEPEYSEFLLSRMSADDIATIIEDAERTEAKRHKDYTEDPRNYYSNTLWALDNNTYPPTEKRCAVMGKTDRVLEGAWSAPDASGFMHRIYTLTTDYWHAKYVIAVASAGIMGTAAPTTPALKEAYWLLENCPTTRKIRHSFNPSTGVNKLVTLK